MSAAVLPKTEARRMGALDAYQVLDTDEELAFDTITELAALVCDTPISLISLLDPSRQWFKSHHGLAARETPREVAFCAHAIHGTEPFVVEDSHADPRFRDNPLVTGPPHVRFYAGIPLRAPLSENVGTLCVIDHVPRRLKARQIDALQRLASHVVDVLEIRRDHLVLRSRVDALQTMLGDAAHDLRSPLANALMMSRMLEMQIGQNSPALSADMACLREQLDHMMTMVDELLASRRGAGRAAEVTDCGLGEIVDAVAGSLGHSAAVAIAHRGLPRVQGVPAQLRRILQNLVNNAVQHHRGTGLRVMVTCETHDGMYEIRVTDNGSGIPADRVDVVRRAYVQTGPRPEGAGLGLVTVRDLVAARGGRTWFETSPNGTTFVFTWPRPGRERQPLSVAIGD